MNISAQKARDIVNEDDEDFEVVETKITGTSRWSIIYQDIVHHTESDQYFRTAPYRRGATENQDERPYEYETGVEFEQVFPRKVLVDGWVTAEQAAEFDIALANDNPM